MEGRIALVGSVEGVSGDGRLEVEEELERVRKVDDGVNLLGGRVAAGWARGMWGMSWSFRSGGRLAAWLAGA